MPAGTLVDWVFSFAGDKGGGSSQNWIYLRTEANLREWYNITLPSHRYASGWVRNSVVSRMQQVQVFETYGQDYSFPVGVEEAEFTYLRSEGQGVTPRRAENIALGTEAFGWAQGNVVEAFRSGRAQSAWQFPDSPCP